MEEKNPLVSVVLPVHNASNSVVSCLKSLLSQSHTNLEIIIVDDFSKDNTKKILSLYRKKDKRIRVFHNKKHYGLTICLNRALRFARGSLVAFMNQNDKMIKQKVEKQVSFLLSHPKVTAVGTQCVFINKEDNSSEKSAFPTTHEAIHQKLLSGASFLFETVMVNRQILPKDILHFSSHPYPLLYTDVFMKIMQYGELANLEESLHLRRQKFDKTRQKITVLTNSIKLWLKSTTQYEYRPPIRNIFSF